MAHDEDRTFGIRQPSATAVPVIVVCERTGHWAAMLRRAALDQEVRILETRHAEECLRMLQSERYAIVAVELEPPRMEDALGLLEAIDRRHQGVRSVVLCAAGMRRWQWIVRELGAVDCITSRGRVADVLALARRHCEQCPRPSLTLREAVLARLPWSR